MREGVQLPRDRGLEFRMTLAIALSVVSLLAALAASVWLVAAGAWVLVTGGLILMAMGFSSAKHRVRRTAGTRLVTPDDTARLEQAAQRLALVAGIRTPGVEVVRDPAPLSWTVAPRRSSPTVYVTTQLLDRVDDRMLQAVVAHEYGHLINRDAVLMSALAGPPAYVVAAANGIVERDWTRAGLWLIVALPASIMLAISRIVCRHRELAADRAAALLTGSPSSVAAALIAIEGSMRQLPLRDLRAVAPLDSFHFVPAGRQPLVPLWATHPSIARRLEYLSDYELTTQRAPSPS